MKKLSKIMVGLMLSTVLIMTVLGCENPVSGGNDAGNGSGNNNDGGDTPSGEVTNPLLGTWATGAFTNTKGKSVIRYYGFTEDILNITEVETVAPSAKVMSVGAERTSTPISKTIYEGSYVSEVDPNNPEKVDFSYQTESGESVATTFTVSGGGTSEKAFSVETTTTTVSGVVTTEAKLEGTAQDGGIPGVATLVDLMGIWVTGDDPYGDGKVKIKEYLEFTQDNKLLLSIGAEISTGDEIIEKLNPYEYSYTVTFDGLKATVAVLSLDESGTVYTFNEDKTSLTFKKKENINENKTSPTFKNRENRDVILTKVVDEPIWVKGHNPDALIGTWKSPSSSFIFTENQMTVANESPQSYSVVFDELKVIVLSSGAYCFTFTDNTKTALTYFWGEGGSETFTKATGATIVDLMGKWVVVYEDNGETKEKEYFEYTEDKMMTVFEVEISTGEKFVGKRFEELYSVKFDGLEATVKFMDGGWFDYVFNEDKSAIVWTDGQGSRILTKVEEIPTFNERRHDPEALIGTWESPQSTIVFDKTTITLDGFPVSYSVVFDKLRAFIFPNIFGGMSLTFTDNNKTSFTLNDEDEIFRKQP